MPEIPSSAVSLSPRIMMDFYAAVFRLYPNITSIQDVIHEDTESFTCTFTVSKTLPPTEHEEMQSALLELIKKRILPALPPGYHSALHDIIIKIPEKPEGILIQDLCHTLQEKFPDIAEIEHSIIGDTVAFSIVGIISPDIKQSIRHTLIVEFPLWSQYQPRDPVFYQQATIKPTSESTQKSVRSWIQSLLKIG